MPLAPVIAAALTTPVTSTISVFVGGRDVTGITDFENLEIQDSGVNVRSTAILQLWTSMVATPEVYDQALVRVMDHSANAEAFRGYVRSRKPITGVEPLLRIIADDIGGLLDDAYIPFEARPDETMQARIGYLWGVYAGAHLSGDLSLVASIGGILPAENFAGVSLRQAIESTISQASPDADYYVEPNGRLHVFTSESNPAPYNVVVGTPVGGEIAPEDLDIDYDSNAYFNRVFVQGATPDASIWRQNDAAIAAANGLVRSTSIQVPECETLAMAQAAGDLFLARAAAAIPRGTFTASSPYDSWRAGQIVAVTEPDIGLSAASFPIAAVTTRFTPTRTGFRREYSVEFGGSQAGGDGAGGPEGIGSGQLVSGNLGGASNTYVNADGVAVTDGTRVRAQLGHLPSGDYGARIVGPGGSVLIDGEKVQLAESEGTIPAGVALGIPQTTVTSSGVKVNDGTDDRVILGAIGGGDYGLKVVSSDGVTVIIDGTANMFKIAATGTLSHTQATNSTGNTEVTLTALGALSTTPAHLSFVSGANTVGSFQRIGRQMTIMMNLFAAGTSGGSPTQRFIGVDWQAGMSVYLNGSNEAVVRLAVDNSSGSSQTAYGRYYVLQEAAL